MSDPAPTPAIDPRLQRQLHDVAARVRARGLHRRSAIAWVALSVVALAWVALCWRFPVLKPASFPVVALAILVVGWIIGGWWRRAPYDYSAAAALIERDHPDLQQALRTAMEQRPAENGAYHFLQRRVIDRALHHAGRHRWEESRRHIKPWLALAHTASLGLLIVVLAFSIQPPDVVVAAFTPEEPPAGEITVTPGNSEVERGSTVMIAARFDGDLPRAATLVWTPAGGTAQRTPMARSLSDPVFALTLPRVEADIDYRVEYHEAASAAFRLQVFERPALVRADASLDYPEFTGLTDRKIEDTRRLSAIEGTKVDYQFMFNKPVKNATLRTAEGDEVPLTAANPERTRYALNFTVTESVRYTLHLTDDAARDNAPPPDIRIEALVNRRPDLKITFPRGDQRVSALEELKLQGEARDDFGLLDYGIAIAIGSEPAHYFSLLQGGDKAVIAKFEQLLTLEEHGVQPDDLVTWFAWADDAAVDGTARRTESDPFFGEVRPFDEIFREQREGGGGQQGSGEQAELLEIQRQIAIGIWKLRQQQPPQSNFVEDVEMLADTQAQARTMLSAAVERERDPTILAAAADAGRFMDQARSHLKDAASQQAVAPLAAAWSAAQGAYQALLRMQPRETNVSQSRNSQGSSSSRNQRQLDQLKFRDNEDNYENQSEAEAMTSPEEREKLETLARLKELARRQQDVNERLQQLQTALQEAQSDAERERIQRELKRLEEEQRQMLSDLDDVRQRIDQQPPSNSTRDSREQLDETRESMREAGESLQQGDVSQALAQGTRAQDNLEQVSDDLRKESSSRFAEQMREARQTARDLAQRQQETQQAIDNLDTQGPRALDSSTERGELADRIEAQQTEHEQLVDQLRQITEDSEVSEPGLHRQLYDLLREHGQQGTDSRMENGAEMLRRGFVDQTRELQPGITEDLEKLRAGVERAAESVLGDETNTLRFAERELDDLSRQLEQERGAEGEGQSEGESGQPGTTGQGREQAQADGESGQRGQEGQQPGNTPGERGQQPGGQGRGERPDDAGTGQSGIAQGDRPGQQPGQGPAGTEPGDQPGSGGAGREPNDQAGTGGQGREPREGEAPGAGEQPGESRGLAQNGEGQQPGQSPGGQEPGQAPGAGQQPGAERGPGESPGQQPGGQGQGQGEGERPQLAQGQSPTPSGQPGQQPGQSGQQPGQQPGQGGEGQSPGQSEGQRPGGSPGPGGQQGGQRSVAQGGGESGGSSAGSTGPMGPTGPTSADDLARAIEALAGNGPGNDETGPITGENFAEWDERLRTVEALLDSSEARARLAAARERARDLRAEYRRHATPPQWQTVDEGIAAPLAEVRTWLRQELARREDPTALQPVDRDPVPERFEENVRKYYEALGE